MGTPMQLTPDDNEQEEIKRKLTLIAEMQGTGPTEQKRMEAILHALKEKKNEIAAILANDH